MADFNPYAPPSADGADRGSRTWQDDGGGLWQDGWILVMAKGADLPPRCIVCNAPATGKPLKRKLSWHASGWYLLVLFNLLFYVIAAMLVRKTATIHVGLCDRHRARRRMWIAIAWALVALCVALPFCLAPFGDDAIFTGSLLIVPAILVAALIGIYGARVVYAKKIDDVHAWVAGACPAYLADLPQWEGP